MAWPLLQHPRSLPDGQPYPWPMLNRRTEDLPRLVEIVARIEHPVKMNERRRSSRRQLFGRGIVQPELAALSVAAIPVRASPSL